jgi:hypothetical protein
VAGIAVPLLAAIALFVAFFLIEHRTRASLLPERLLRSRSLATANATRGSGFPSPGRAQRGAGVVDDALARRQGPCGARPARAVLPRSRRRAGLAHPVGALPGGVGGGAGRPTEGG